MKVITLVSCMHEKDTRIIERLNIQTDVVVVNQCDKDSKETLTFVNIFGEQCVALFINTIERGLSKSRNMAIENSWGDICVFCDDDEVFVDNYGVIIGDAFQTKANADIIAFKLVYDRKVFRDTEYQYNRFSVTSVSSAQVAFRRKVIVDSGIRFDDKLGSGSGNGGGEENKFLFQLLCQGKKAFYLPVLIATVSNEKESLWFKGYTNKHVVDKGWGYRRIFGAFYAYPLLWYHAFKHHNLYGMSFFKTLALLHKGFLETR